MPSQLTNDIINLIVRYGDGHTLKWLLILYPGAVILSDTWIHILNKLSEAQYHHLMLNTKPELLRLHQYTNKVLIARPPFIITPQRQSLMAHTDTVKSLTLLHKNRLVSASFDKTIKTWNLETESSMKTFAVHPDWTASLCPLLNSYSATCSSHSTIEIKDLETNTSLQTLTGHPGWARCLAPLHNNRLASGSDRGQITIWNLRTGTCEQTLVGHEDSVEIVIPLPYNHLASGAHDKTIKIWDLKTGTCEQTFAGHSNCARCLAFLPNNCLASGSIDRIIKIWDLASGACLKEIPCASPVRSMACSQGTLYAGMENGLIQRFDLAQIDYAACVANFKPE